MALPPPPLLSKLLHLPATQAREVRAACNPAVALVDEDLNKLRADLSSVRGGARIQQMERSLRDAYPGQFQIHLFTGHPGSGKTTELRWLIRELQTPKEDRTFHALYIDVLDFLDVRDVQLPEFLAMLAIAIVSDPILKDYVGKSQSIKGLWKKLASWFKTLGFEFSAEFSEGFPKLKLTLKTTPGLQQRFRDTSRDHTSWLIQQLGDVLQEVRNELITKQGIEDLVLVVDNLERLERVVLDKDSNRTSHDLFFLEQLPLVQNLPVHMVVTIPIPLLLTQNRLGRVFNNPIEVVLPMIAVHPQGKPTERSQPGIDALKKLLRLRIDTDVVFADEDALEYTIVQSGGSIRDLLRIVGQAVLLKPEMKFSRQDIDRVVREFVGNLERVLQGKKFLQELHHIAETGCFPEAFDMSDRQWLLHELIVLEYNGTTWYDVHPFASLTQAYLRAGEAHQGALSPKPIVSSENSG